MRIDYFSNNNKFAVLAKVDFDRGVKEEETSFCIEAIEDTVISIVKNGSPTPTKSLLIKINNGDWQGWDESEVSLTQGQKMYIISLDNFGLGISSGNYRTFSSTGKFSISGILFSLVNYSTTLVSYAFYKLFNNCTKLVSAKNLILNPITSRSCYENMFNGCTSLTAAPALPATTLANYCYSNMFNGCTSLTAAPALPATTSANHCYFEMFRGCTSLTTAPSILPATTLAESCYQYMFYGCSSLVNAPALPATTLLDYCYSYMFYGCKFLVTAPELPATTLAKSCYSCMFSNCSNLNYIKAMFIDLPSTTYTDSWLYLVKKNWYIC